MKILIWKVSLWESQKFNNGYWNTFLSRQNSTVWGMATAENLNLCRSSVSAFIHRHIHDIWHIYIYTHTHTHTHICIYIYIYIYDILFHFSGTCSHNCFPFFLLGSVGLKKYCRDCHSIKHKMMVGSVKCIENTEKWLSDKRYTALKV